MYRFAGRRRLIRARQHTFVVQIDRVEAALQGLRGAQDEQVPRRDVPWLDPARRVHFDPVLQAHALQKARERQVVRDDRHDVRDDGEGCQIQFDLRGRISSVMMVLPVIERGAAVSREAKQR